MGAALKRGPCLFTWVIDAWQNERGPAPSDESPTLPAEEVIQAKTKSPVAYTPPGAQLQSTSGGRTLKVSPSPARKPTVHFFTRVQYNACVIKETGGQLVSRVQIRLPRRYHCQHHRHRKRDQNQQLPAQRD